MNWGYWDLLRSHRAVIKIARNFISFKCFFQNKYLDLNFCMFVTGQTLKTRDQIARNVLLNESKTKMVQNVLSIYKAILWNFNWQKWFFYSNVVVFGKVNVNHDKCSLNISKMRETSWKKICRWNLLCVPATYLNRHIDTCSLEELLGFFLLSNLTKLKRNSRMWENVFRN